MDQRIEQAIFYITQNYYKPLVLDVICANAGLSKFHFHRMFKRDTGLTPLQFWHQIRFQHAQHYALQYPNSKQLEVAFICGFVSPPIFARAFQKEMGISMLEFRNRNSISSNTYKIDDRILPFDMVYLNHKTGINSKKKTYEIPSNYYLKLGFNSKKTLREELRLMDIKIKELFPQVKIVKNTVTYINNKPNVAYFTLKLI